MPALDQRVANLELATERNTDFVNEKLVEHAVRLDRIEHKVDVLDRKVDKLSADVAAIRVDVAGLKVDVAGLKSGVEALPAVIAQIIRDEFASRDRKSAS